MAHFVIHKEWYLFGYGNSTNRIVSVAHSEKEANDTFKKLIAKEKDYQKGWKVLRNKKFDFLVISKDGMSYVKLYVEVCY